MSEHPTKSLISEFTDDEVLAQVLFDLADRKRRGEAIDLEAAIAAQPHYAAELRRLFPMMNALAGLENTGAASIDAPGWLGTIGDYQIIREIGRGGMGIVYEARQISLSRRVALKILPFAAALDPRSLARFKQESLAAAQLDHPHIVHVYGVGSERGVHYYAMQFIDGPSLAQVIAEMREKVEEIEKLKGSKSKNDFAGGGCKSPGNDRGESSSELPIDDPEATLVFPTFARAGAAGVASSTSEIENGELENVACGGGTALTASSDPPFHPLAKGGRLHVNPTPQLPDPKSEIPIPKSPTALALRAAGISTDWPGNRTEFYRGVARLGIQAAEALDYAHQRGVLHRDVKPGNLLLDDGGKVYITDFGLARIESETNLTRTGDLMGTLRYMSPEQATSARGLVDQRTDVYSLGATLYELLTLRPVFTADDRAVLLSQIAEVDPSPLRKFDRRIPEELETILLKCLEKEPSRRYVTERALADDLQRYLASKPIAARQPSLADRAKKWARRNKPIVTGFALFLVFLSVASPIIAITQASLRQLAEINAGKAHNALGAAQTAEAKAQKREREAETARLDERRQRTLAERRLEITKRMRYASDMQRARHALETGDVPRMREILGLYRATDSDDDRQIWEWQYLNESSPKETAGFNFPTGGLRTIAMNRDGTRIAVEFDRSAAVWETGKAEPMWVSPVEDMADSAIQFNDADTKVSIIENARSLLYWEFDAATGDVNFQRPHNAAAFLNLGHHWLWSPAPGPGNPPAVVLRDTGGARQIHVPDRFGLPRFAPNGSQIAFIGPEVRNGDVRNDDRLVIVNADSGDPAFTRQGKTHPNGSQRELFEQCAWSPDSTRLAVGSLVQPEPRERHEGGDGFNKDDCDSIITILDAHTGAEQASFSLGRQKRYGISGADGESLVWSPTGDRVAVSEFAQIGVFPVISDARSIMLPTLWKDRVPIFFSPDGAYVAACRPGNGLSQIWNAATGEELPLGFVANLAWHPSGRWVAGAVDGFVKVFELISGLPVLTVPKGGSRNLVRFAWSADGTRLAFGGGGDRHVSVWAFPVRRDAAVVLRPGSKRIEIIRERGDEPVFREPHALPRDMTAWSPNGTQIVAGNGKRELEIWDVKSASIVDLIARVDVRAAAHQIVAWHPDGEAIAVAENTKKNASVLDPEYDYTHGKVLVVRRKGLVASAESSELIGKLPRGVRWLGWNRSGRRLAAVSGSGEVIVTNWKSGKVLQRWQHLNTDIARRWRGGHALTGAWSPNGLTLASAGEDGVILMWNIQSGDALLPFRGHGVPVYALDFNADGNWLASAGDDRVIRIWDVATRNELLQLRGHTSGIASLAWSPDGERLASAGRDGTVRLWDPVVGAEVLRLDGHSDEVTSVNWSPDGRQLASSSLDGSIRIWSSIAVHGPSPATSAGESPEELRRLATSHQRLAVIYLSREMHDQGEEEMRSAANVRRSLVEMDPKSRIDTVELGVSLGGLSVVLGMAGRLDESALVYEEAAALLDEASGIPFSPSRMRLHADFAEVLANHRRYFQAAKAFQRAIHDTPAGTPVMIRLYTRVAEMLTSAGEPSEALNALREMIRKLESEVARTRYWESKNHLAWILVTHPFKEIHDPQRAVELAREVIDQRRNFISKAAGAPWNTLGVAQYRAGRFDEAVASLQESMNRTDGGNSFDWFFMALAHWELLHKDEARQWFDKAVEWMDRNGPQDEELLRFRSEAAELLGIDETTKGAQSNPGEPSDAAGMPSNHE